MAGQTCRISQSGKEKIEEAIEQDGRSKTVLAEAAGISRDTLYKILKPSTVRFESLTSLCFELGLEADELIEGEQQSPDFEIEKLVQRLRQHVAPQIQQRCGVMRVLDMTQPIDSTAIYTDVNILERVTSKTRSDLEQLMQGMDAENFDRFCLGQVREERVAGLDALTRHRLLMILGRPGAGKTTFLKRLAMWCKASKRGLEAKVPIFVTLKEVADARRKHEELIDFIAERYELTESKADLAQLLKAGRALVLLDGLDEVQNTEHERVLTAIREFGHKYEQNQIVITCRIAAQEYIFQQFTEVEVADFQDEQIQDFANKWFLAKHSENVDQEGKSIVSQLFWKELEQNEPVKELATNPLLLTLLCLEFSEDCGFPSSRAELYERGLNILFTKWDGTRQIKRDQAYKNLPVMRKKALLAQLAWTTFEQGDYFFKQAVAEKQIQQYIQNLPGASDDDETLLLDSAAVLHSIEAQHGLLTQRAVEIYSFSHLTFHEYFSASQISSRKPLHEELVKKIYDKRYREVFLLVSEKLEDAGSLFLAIEDKNSRLVNSNKQIKLFLVQQSHQARIISTSSRKLIAYRAFYCYITLGYILEIEGKEKFKPMLSDIKALIDERTSKILTGETEASEIQDNSTAEACLKLDLEIMRALTLYQKVEQSIESALDRVSYSNHSLIEAYNVSGDRSFERSIDSAHTLFRGLLKNLESICSLPEGVERKENLLKLLSDVQNSQIGTDKSSFIRWWNHGSNRQWFQDLQNLVSPEENSLHNWTLQDKDLHILRDYYRGSRLLFDCLNSECYISRDVRQQIEYTLLVHPSTTQLA